MLAWRRMLRCSNCKLPWPAAARCRLKFMLGRRAQLRASCAPAATLWRISQEMHRGSAEQSAAVFGQEGSGEPGAVYVEGESGMEGHRCRSVSRRFIPVS